MLIHVTIFEKYQLVTYSLDKIVILCDLLAHWSHIYDVLAVDMWTELPSLSGGPEDPSVFGVVGL